MTEKNSIFYYLINKSYFIYFLKQSSTVFKSVISLMSTYKTHLIVFF